jgi:S-DNA-T family DNA segregation ATPase FtsK/SpoIIIE
LRLKLTLARPRSGTATDLLVTVDTTVTVGELARTLAERDPARDGMPGFEAATLRIDDGPGRVLPPHISVADAGLGSGQTLTVTDGSGRFVAGQDTPAMATLHVLAGPDAGLSFPLRAGANQVGRERGNDVRLTDSLVSKHHARINVGETVEVIDLGSSNGVLIGGEPVPRAVIRADDTVLLGDSLIRVQPAATQSSDGLGGVQFNRSPHLDLVYEGDERELPEPPPPPQNQRLPIIPLIAPVLMGSIMFAITRQLVTVLFVAMSPVMMLGNVIENRVFNKKSHRRAMETYQVGLVNLDVELTQERGVEAEVRRGEHPPLEVLVGASTRREPLLWCRRPDQRGFAEVRLGVGTLPTRSELELPRRADMAPDLWAQLVALRDRHAMVPAVPVVATLAECGSLGVAGPRRAVLDSARAIVAALASLHSPAEIVVAGLCSSAGAREWDWLKWLPHVGSDHSPLPGDHLVASPGGAARILAALDDLLDAREEASSGSTDGPSLPVVVVLVDDPAVERSRLVDLAERGRHHSVHFLWLAPSVAALPAACRTYVDIDPARPDLATAGYVVGGTAVVDVALERLDQPGALALARRLAPVVDAGALVDDDSDLPRSVSLVTLAGTDLLQAPTSVIDRWRTSSSIPAEFAGVRRKKDHNLRAFVGASAGQSFVLDLREHGPHALVGGTTGSGKSEFLQSWVLGLALEHSPARVTFLFVDYKGGAAFSECVNLPHSVGLVTDLSPHLVRRALTSLNAELRHREHILQAKKAKDLLELERRGDAEAPPSLVIVVDEFAALVKEVPEFVDGVVNVAQRGRSLGLHLVLATQRPAGVIKDNLRANTNLRIALRMADEDDSTDVVGSKLAGGFDPSIPGRGVAKMGPGRLTPFQSGYAGGWTSDTPPPPIISVEELTFGVGGAWEAPDAGEQPAPSGPTDLERLVAQVRAAHDQLSLPDPRRPWLDTLAESYDLARSPQSRTDAELIFAIADDPEDQRQVPVAFHPDRDGNMVVYGTGGSGKSGFLRTLAVVAGLGLRGGPCHVYGLDFGARGLQMLEPLPHVGSIINGDDSERVQRLLRQLRETIDERATRYAAVNASSIVDYRAAADAPDEPRVLVLVDGMGAFRQAYEATAVGRWFDLFQQIAADGRQVGVHVVVSADRPSAIPTALASVIQKRLVLRLASTDDYLSMGVPSDVLESTSSPGRGIYDGLEAQVTILGGTANTARQARNIERLAAELAASSGRAPAPSVERLADRVALDELPVLVDGLPALGVADDTLGPFGFVPDDVLLVVGPPQSGKTTTMATIALSLHRSKPGSLAYLGPGRSMLRSLVPWVAEAVGVDAVADLARRLGDDITEGLGPSAIVLEDLSAFLGGSAEAPLQDLIKACRAAGVFVATDCETSAMASWPLHLAVKASRHGIALQPDQFDGDTVFKTPFPRMSRAEFPAGRGIYVRRGTGRRVQVALPEVEVT